MRRRCSLRDGGRLHIVSNMTRRCSGLSHMRRHPEACAENLAVSNAYPEYPPKIFVDHDRLVDVVHVFYGPLLCIQQVWELLELPRVARRLSCAPSFASSTPRRAPPQLTARMAAPATLRPQTATPVQ